MKKCLYCNYENDDKAVFCSDCGRKLDEPDDTKALSEDEIADGFKPDYGYGRLKGYNTLLFENCKQARQNLVEMPHQAIKKVCIIVETIARDYYKEAIYCKTMFSVEELYGKQPPVKITKNISDIINELYETQLINDTIKDAALGITGTRNTVDYGNTEEFSQITRRTATGIYYSGEKVTDFFISAVENEPIRRFKQLEDGYPDLFRKAKDAKKLMDGGDLFATIDELGNLLRRLYCELYAKYKKFEDVRTVKYADAKKLICRYSLISSEAQEVVYSIIDKRNKHHHLENTPPKDYVENAYMLTSRLVVYLLEEINNSKTSLLRIKLNNSREYYKIINYLLEHNRKTFENKYICFFQNNQPGYANFQKGTFTYEKHKNEYADHYFYCICSCVNKLDNNSLNSFDQFVFCSSNELYSFKDYLRDSYPNLAVETLEIQESPDNSEQSEFSICYVLSENIKTMPEFNQKYEQYKLDLQLEQEQSEEKRKLKEIKDQENINVFDNIFQEIIRFFLSGGFEFCRITWLSNKCTKIGFNDADYLINAEGCTFDEYLQTLNPPISYNIEKNILTRDGRLLKVVIPKSAIENDERYIEENEKQKLEEEKKQAETKKRKRRKVIAIGSAAAALVLCVAILIIIQFIYTSRPEYRFESAVKSANNYEAAKVADTLGLNSDKILELTKELINDTKKDFANDEIDNTKAKNTIACIKEIKIPGTEQMVADADKYIDNMQKSHEAYTSGQTSYSAKYYVNAAESFYLVDKEDGYYQSAQSKIAEIKDLCISEALENAAKEEKSNNIVSAYLSLNRISKIYDDKNLKEKTGEYQKAASQIIKKSLDDAAKCASENDYVSAIRKIQSIKNYKMSPELLSACNNYRKEYCNYLTALVNENKNKDWMKAENAITEASIVFLSDQDSSNTKDECYMTYLKLKDQVDQDKRPDSLDKLINLNNNEFENVFIEELDNLNSNNTSYYKPKDFILRLKTGNDPAPAIFALQKNYSHMRGTLAISDNSKEVAIWDREDNEALNGTIIFYGGDENKDYELIDKFTYSQEDKPKEIDIDLSGYKYLKIELIGNKHGFPPAEKTRVCLVNCYLYE